MFQYPPLGHFDVGLCKSRFNDDTQLVKRVFALRCVYVYEQTKYYHEIEKTLTDGRGLAVSVVAKLAENFHEYS